MYLILRNTLLYCFMFTYLVMSGDSKKCHSFYRERDSKYYLSTKTPYSYIANNTDDPLYFNGCSPTRIWAIIRHGTRNPGRTLVDKMRINLPALKTIVIGHHESEKGNLCSEVVENLRTWEPSADPSELKFLTHEGEEEMILLGERFQNRFLDLLPETYSNKTYKFRHTATQRARESARSFTVGLFGRKQKAYVWYPEALAKDPILRRRSWIGEVIGERCENAFLRCKSLRKVLMSVMYHVLVCTNPEFYKLCDKWQVEVDKNPEALKELEKFKTKPIVTRMLENISQRIGMTNRFKFDDAKLIYQTCGFETAWHPKSPSPWCGLLSKDDFEILEFASDLDYYWIDGYGFPINYQQACVAVNDMFQHLTDERYPQNTFYFTHSGTILKVLSYLGLYKDPQPLQADLFNKSRLWRTSQIDAFGSNLAFILYKCKDGDKILTLHQERPVTLPGCPEGDLCPLETLKKVYQHSINECNFQKLCRLDRDL